MTIKNTPGCCHPILQNQIFRPPSITLKDKMSEKYVNSDLTAGAEAIGLFLFKQIPEYFLKLLNLGCDNKITIAVAGIVLVEVDVVIFGYIEFFKWSELGYDRVLPYSCAV